MLLMDNAGKGRIGKIPLEMCTLDHLEPRWHPLRGKLAHQGWRLVAACHRCNGERDREQLKLVPPELLQKAAAGHKPIELAKAHAELLHPVFPTIGVPQRQALRFTFEPKPRVVSEPFRVSFAELIESQRA